MSGGAFDYSQFHIGNIADSIESVILENGAEKPMEERWGEDDTHYHAYSEETIKEFKEAIKLLKWAWVYTQRIDWLLSGDDGEEIFHKRLKEDLSKL
jgi:hypothetical protein